MGWMVAVVAVVTAVSGALPPAAAAGEPTSATAGPVEYRPPVDAPPTDAFRPPAHPYGPGNRGIDYATAEGQPVVAAADGQVVFAGRVGGGLHVVVLHRDGIRTSYSFLREVAARRGDAVAAGALVGLAGGEGLHFGARAGDTYLDPMVLFGRGEGRVRLVADPQERIPLSEAHERRRLEQSLRGLVLRGARGGHAAARWLGARAVEAVERRVDLALVLAHDAASLGAPTAVHLAVAAVAWEEEQRGCTPGAQPVPPPVGRRIAILVGGLGSSTGSAAVLGVDTAALGYGAADVHQFSYRRDGLPYGPRDTAGDITAAGHLLAEQVARLGREHPGTAVDVIAHSQGGLVAQSALTVSGARGVATLVTLGTPHQGADWATAAAALTGTATGRAVAGAAGRLRIGVVAADAPSLRQMAETSEFLHRLPSRGWPATTRVVTVAARFDFVVPNTHSRLGAAPLAVVTLSGARAASDHARLPGSPEATREAGLAIAGLRPTCRPLVERLHDVWAARQAAILADAVGAAVAVGGLWADARTRAALLRRGR